MGDLIEVGTRVNTDDGMGERAGVIKELDPRDAALPYFVEMDGGGCEWFSPDEVTVKEAP